MNCDEFNERLAGFLYGETDGADREMIEAHLSACPTCAQETASLRATRSLLSTWEAPDTDVDVEAVLAGATSGRTQPTGIQRRWRHLRSGVVGVAAGVAAFLFASQLPVGWLAGGTTPRADAAGRQYLLLLYQEPGGSLSAEESENRVGEYSAWASAGRRAGTILMGAKLASARQRLPDLGERHPSPDEPGNDDDVVVGYFRLSADSMEEALKIARTCPHLRYGGRLELRPIDDKPRG